MSATAVRNGTTLIAVVMGSTSKDIRYKDAATLLDYGFSNCKPYTDEKALDGKHYLKITDGTKDKIAIESANPFHTVIVGGLDPSSITKKLTIIKDFAPIKKGELVGRVDYMINDTTIGSVDILASEDVEQRKFSNVLDHLFKNFINVK